MRSETLSPTSSRAPTKAQEKQRMVSWSRVCRTAALMQSNVVAELSGITRLSSRKFALAEANSPPRALAAGLRFGSVAVLAALWAKLFFGGFASGLSLIEARFGSHSLALALMS